MDSIINNDLLTICSSIKKKTQSSVFTRPRMDDGIRAGWFYMKPELKRVYIKIKFVRLGANKLIIGFVVRKGPEREALLGKITDDMLQSEGWIYKNIPVYSNWFNADAVKAILDGHTMIEIISSGLDKLLDASKGLDL